MWLQPGNQSSWRWGQRGFCEHLFFFASCPVDQKLQDTSLLLLLGCWLLALFWSKLFIFNTIININCCVGVCTCAQGEQTSGNNSGVLSFYLYVGPGMGLRSPGLHSKHLFCCSWSGALSCFFSFCSYGKRVGFGGQQCWIVWWLCGLVAVKLRESDRIQWMAVGLSATLLTLTVQCSYGGQRRQQGFTRCLKSWPPSLQPISLTAEFQLAAFQRVEIPPYFRKETAAKKRKVYVIILKTESK